jgi:hypothetical protein
MPMLKVIDSAAFCRMIGWLVMALLLCLGGPTGAEVGPGQGAPATVVEARPRPVIVIIFDELPLSSLLDASGEIDEARYPTFARLADTSTSFSAITSVGARILDAVPPMLTGIRPGVERKLPINSQHPNNLFSLLEPTHALHVEETYTLVRAPRYERPKGEPDPQIEQITRIRRDFHRSMDQPQQIQRFASRIPNRGGRLGSGGRSLHFLHVMLPTFPWRFTPDGSRYEPARIYGSKANGWLEESWWVDDAYRRHLLQLEYTDSLLGGVLESLDRAGLFDDALLIVTASFGTAFWPGESRLEPNRSEHPEAIMHVPLLIKQPGQKKASVDARPGETVDLLPTIADLLDIAPDWAMDGCSLFSDACPARTERLVLCYGDRHIGHFPMDITERRTTLERKLALTGSGADHSKFVRIGPYAEIVGTLIAAHDIEMSLAGTLSRRRRRGPAAVGQPELKLNKRVTGDLVLEAEYEGPPQVAVAVGGVIAMVVPAMSDRKTRQYVAALLPDSAFDGPRLDIALFLVWGYPANPRLAPLIYE